jgi:hypothetical protein
MPFRYLYDQRLGARFLLGIASAFAAAASNDHLTLGVASSAVLSIDLTDAIASATLDQLFARSATGTAIFSHVFPPSGFAFGIDGRRSAAHGTGLLAARVP